MLNNLAASFQSSVRNEEIDNRSRKRQKNEVYPAYLLNLCCPRSSYDLHFEPSRTIVEFKVIHDTFILFSPPSVLRESFVCEQCTCLNRISS